MLMARIRAIFEASDGTYGSPRIRAALKHAGIHVSCKRVARLMREGGLKARVARIYRRTVGTRVFFSAIPNLTLDVETCAPNQIWVGDVTYLKCGSTWRYLAVVMDRHSRRILGWSLKSTRGLSLTLTALNHALRHRRPNQGLIFHSDRGSEFSAYAFRTRLAAFGVTQSMKRPRELGDNAFIESFFHSLKAERIHGRTFTTDSDLRSAVSTYVRTYNRSRLHSGLGYLSPIDYERRAA
jgi:putative transposase